MKLSSHGNEIRIDLSFWESVWAIKRTVRVRADQLLEVHSREPITGWMDLRTPGTFVPGLIRAGSYLTKRGWEFWFAVRKYPFLTLELKDHRYKRLVLTSREADAWIRKINAALPRA